jgi:hypothetical protein
MAMRNQNKGDAAIQKLHQDTGGKSAIFLKLDLADLKSVKAAAEEFMRCASCPPPQHSVLRTHRRQQRAEIGCSL